MVGSFIANDLASIFDVEDFSTSATFTASGEAAVAVAGIFDDEDVEMDQGDSRFIQRSAKFTCAAASVVGIAKDDAFTIDGTDYTVAFFKDDGTGVIEIYMELA